jgi:hypothetical protein
MTSSGSDPESLVPAIVHLVETGPVELGAYTVAELTVVDAIVDFLAARPSDEVLAEAVRSLAARKFLTAGPVPEQVEVRGDLGIVTAFQRRARMVLDARVTGTEPGEPWRILLLPQPEPITMMVRIDVLGIHEISLRTRDEALKMLSEWLPRGRTADRSVSPDEVLAEAERSALVTVTRYTAQGSAETATSSKDMILARHHDQLHAFSRDPDDASKLRPGALGGQNLVEALAGLLAEPVS